MMKKLVALSLAAMLSSNAFAGTNVETENLKKAAAAVAEKTVALKAAGMTDTEVLAVMEQDINNMTGDATTPVVKNNKKMVIAIVLGALATAGLVYGGYRLYRHYRPATPAATTPAVDTKTPATDKTPAASAAATTAAVAPAASAAATTAAVAPAASAAATTAAVAPAASAAATTAAVAPAATTAAVAAGSVAAVTATAAH